MIPIFSFIGESKSGKTFLLEKVIIELRSRGFRVGVIKHSHSPFEIDKREKDSWKFKEAGAEVVAFSSKEEFLLFKKLKNEISLDEIIKKYFNNVDIILTEGYRKENFPKILVLSGENKENFLSPKYPRVQTEILLIEVKEKRGSSIFQDRGKQGREYQNIKLL